MILRQDVVTEGVLMYHNIQFSVRINTENNLHFFYTSNHAIVNQY